MNSVDSDRDVAGSPISGPLILVHNRDESSSPLDFADEGDGRSAGHDTMNIGKKQWVDDQKLLSTDHVCG